MEDVSPLLLKNWTKIYKCGFFKYRMWFRKLTLLFTNRNCILLVLRIKKMERIWKHGMVLYCVKFVRYWKYCLDYLRSTVWRETAFHLFQDHFKKKKDVKCSLHISTYMVPWPKATHILRSLPFDFQIIIFKEWCCFSLIFNNAWQYIGWHCFISLVLCF